MAKYRFNKYQKEWLKKLRSGRFKQGTGTLRDSKGRYCCLGVAARACGVRADSAALNHLDALESEEHLSLEWVTDKMRLIDASGAFARDTGIGDALYGDLASLNDMGDFTFNEIADFIEQHPELVFNNARP